MMAYHWEKGGLGVLHLIPVDDPSPFGCVVHDAQGRVTAFVEKPPREQAPTNEINAGTYLLEPDVLDAIPAGRAVSIEREIFPEILAGSRPLYAYTTTDYWIDVGRPDQYLQAHRDILDGRLRLGPLADPESHRGRTFALGGPDLPPGIRPPVFLGEGVELEPGAQVGPYAVLGDDTHVGKGANVSSSVVWDNVRIETGASIRGSILASNVHVGSDEIEHEGTVVGHDAEIEPNTVVPPHSRVDAREVAQA
jgi:NDP-sugar pyrophosphorylase family protein